MTSRTDSRRLRRRLEELTSRAQTLPKPHHQLVEETLEAFAAALRELEAQEEELRHQEESEARSRSSLDRMRTEVALMDEAEDMYDVTITLHGELRASGMSFDECLVYLFDEETGPTEVRGCRITSEGFVNVAIDPEAATKIRTVWRHRDPIVGTGSGVRIADVPFSRGVIRLGGIQMDALSDDDMEFLQNLAEEFADGYDRAADLARLEFGLRRETARLRAIARIAVRLNAQLELKAAGRTVCREAARLLDAPVAFLMLSTQDRCAFEFISCVGVPAKTVERFAPIPRSFYDRYVRKIDRGMIFREVQDIPDLPNRDLFLQQDLRSAMVVSLTVEREPAGLLMVLSRGRPRDFGSDEKAMLQGLANHAVLSIRNAWLFDEVRTGRERLTTLSRQLMDVQEAERRHLGRELHDEMGQMLTGLKLLLEASGEVSEDEDWIPLDMAKELVNELIAQVRSLALNLRPSMLDDLGVLPALQWYVRRYQEQTQIRVDFEHVGLTKRRFASEIETAVYRIVQEALTNVARHAGVDEVAVRVRVDEDTVCLEIKDEGVGFSPKEVRDENRSGLLGIAERARLAGGRLEIVSSPGEGTRVDAVLPLE